MLSIDQPVSLAPLAQLPKLETVWIGGGAVVDVEALLDAPALEVVELGQYVRISDGELDDINEKIRARGIATSQRKG
ncbi:hypothetical protein FIV42_21595 [Persicimonas caeni]|uniref:Uncharacterized protein n=1 Tax=Persicimonas caeni TaxID=2292766 RepID=A0A4Y6PZR7_PERCE|nr:hypothetical protein [Persicimonas caeni]QDG53245.1 hypothetical protein FIV42_21595 [Persicimonas caeni]QED34467.1 hypothetical protein FRD00_21590 [Persicimonas caeni]